MKTKPFGAVWDYYCMQQDVPVSQDVLRWVVMTRCLVVIVFIFIRRTAGSGQTDIRFCIIPPYQRGLGGCF